MAISSRHIVAVVDDDPRIRESLESLLESAGFQTQIFEFAEEFLRRYSFAQASCLITDVRMPGIDGLELQRRIRSERPNLPIIFITGHHEERAEQRAFEEGAAFIFHKPFDGEDLLRAIYAVVETSLLNESATTPG